MDILTIIFWFCAALVFYVFVGYASLLAVVAKLRNRETRRQAGYTASVSFVTCARDEKKIIGQRIAELRNLIADADVTGEVIVVCDGCTDGTPELAREQPGDNIRVIELPAWQGKAAGLSAGVNAARHDILVFADCRQRWDSNALTALLENFADPTIGAVSGDLVLEPGDGVISGVGRYWRFEKWLRKKESRIHSTVGVTGAICAVRRDLFPGVPSGMVLDDVYWPLRLTMQNFRVVHDQRAIARDRLPERARDEFWRKVRTLAGNFQLIGNLPQALLPGCNPVWWQFLSHKVLRLAVPWALLLMLLTSIALPGTVYWFLLVAQILGYSLAAVGLVPALARRVPLAAAAASVLVLVGAAGMAFFVWFCGLTRQAWRPTPYGAEPGPLPISGATHLRPARVMDGTANKAITMSNGELSAK